MNEINVVLISGHAGVGKSTFARFLQKHILEDLDSIAVNCVIIPFAAEVKKYASLMDWDGKKDEKGRKFLQHLGDTVREYDRDTWARKMYANAQEQYFRYDKYNFIVLVDDWRFYNEKSFLESCGCNLYCIRIEAPNRETLRGTLEYNHISETELPSGLTENEYTDAAYDFIIDNTGSMEELEENAKFIAAQTLYWINQIKEGE